MKTTASILVTVCLAACGGKEAAPLTDERGGGPSQPECRTATARCMPTIDQGRDQASTPTLAVTNAASLATGTGLGTTTTTGIGAQLGVVQALTNIAESSINFLGSNEGVIEQTPGFFTAVPKGTQSYGDITTWEVKSHYKSMKFTWPAFSALSFDAGTAASFILTLKWEASGTDGSYPRSLWVSVYPQDVHVKNRIDVTGIARLDFAGMAAGLDPGQTIGQISLHFTMTVKTLFAGVSTKDVSCTVTANMSPDFINAQGLSDNPDAICY